MYKFVGNYCVQTGNGFNLEKCSVILYESFDQDGLGVNGKLVYIGTWKECTDYVLKMAQVKESELHS